MRRSSPSRVFVLVFLGLALASGAGVGALRGGAVRFDRICPGLIDPNREPRNRAEALATAEAHPRRVEAHWRTGVAPNVCEELAREPSAER